MARGVVELRHQAVRHPGAVKLLGIVEADHVGQPDERRSALSAPDTVGAKLVRPVPQLPHGHAHHRVAHVLQGSDDGSQPLQEQRLVALVGVAHQHPLGALLLGCFQQLLLVALLVPDMGLGAGVPQQRQQPGFAGCDVAGRIRRAVVQDHEAVHMFAQMVEAVPEVALLVVGLDDADDPGRGMPLMAGRGVAADAERHGVLEMLQPSADGALAPGSDRHGHGGGRQLPAQPLMVSASSQAVGLPGHAIERAPPPFGGVGLGRAGRALAQIGQRVVLAVGWPGLGGQVQQLDVGAGHQPRAVHLQAHADVVIVAAPFPKALVVPLDGLELRPAGRYGAVHVHWRHGLGGMGLEGASGPPGLQIGEGTKGHPPEHHTARHRVDHADRQGRHVGDEQRFGRADQHPVPRGVPQADVDGFAGRLPGVRLVVDQHLPLDLRVLAEECHGLRLGLVFVQHQHHFDPGPREVRKVERQDPPKLGQLLVERKNHTQHIIPSSGLVRHGLLPILHRKALGRHQPKGVGQGRWAARISSNARAMRNTPRSSKRWPAICRPIGRPPAV